MRELAQHRSVINIIIYLLEWPCEGVKKSMPKLGEEGKDGLIKDEGKMVWLVI